MGRESSAKSVSGAQAYKLYALAACLALAAVVFVGPALATGQKVGGRVTCGGRPVAGASVRLQGVGPSALTDERGLFTLTVPSFNPTRYVTAGKVGYYTGRARLAAPGQELVIDLREIPKEDNKDYHWQDPTPDVRSQDNCGNCHSRIYREWAQDAHARSAVNPLVRTMYSGTDVRGRPNIGPGYRLDWSDEGNCTTCHAPAAALSQHMDVSRTQGVESMGVSCDLCHKIQEVRPDFNQPNTAEVNFLRPPPDAKLLFGPFDDATFPDEVPDFSYSPLFKSSHLCAACHDGSFWGVPVYETFTEWRKSSYASLGVQCQSCHMGSTGKFELFADQEKGGKLRAPETIASHRMMGDDPAQFLRSAVTMETSARVEDGLLTVTVKVANVGAGHDVPTGQPMRNMILVVTAEDESARPLRFMSGESVPVWGGGLAGRPGKGFAKILLTLNEYATSPHILNEEEAADFPAPFWRRNRILSDNRIQANGSDQSSYIFGAPKTPGRLSVRARLIYRRAFAPLAAAKGWDVPDVTVAANGVEVEKP
ncbi:MAG: hypothetical protein JOZ02_00520 [Acidobacteria bacterium]|nr:hypothetical protein [Acidobacteriota bacterium]